MRRVLSFALVGLVASGAVHAQLWGGSPYQNGPAPDQGGLFLFDPDSLTWLDGRQLTMDGFSVNVIHAVTMHPKDPPGTPVGQRKEGTMYAVLELSAVSGRVLATVDPTTGIATTIGNLGDDFSSLAFRDDGQLFGVTDDSASVPEALYLIDKSTGAKTLAAQLGGGSNGEVIAFHPVDGFFYHWSGTPSTVFEKVMAVPPHVSTAVPIIGTIPGETTGAIWDPCRPRNFGAAGTGLGFIGSHVGATFNVWRANGTVTASAGTAPDVQRGLALVGGYGCDADLGLGAGSPDPNPAPGAPISVLLVVDNAGEARAMDPVLTITVPASMGTVTTTGCLEDPNGMPTCTPRIVTPRYVSVPTPGYVDFPLASLWKGRSVTITLNGLYDGNAGAVVASVASGSTETRPEDNSVRYPLGNTLLVDSFE